MAHIAASVSHAVCDHRDQQQFDAAFNIALVSRLWRTHFNDHMKALGQTEARWKALHAISLAPHGIIQADLAERLGISGPSLVRIIDGLEQQRLVRRNPISGDRRANSISIENNGLEVLAVLEGFARKMRQDAFEHISDSDLATTLSVLRRVGDRLGASPDMTISTTGPNPVRRRA